MASSLAAALAMLVWSRHEAPGLGRFFLTMPYVVFALLVPLQFPIENVVARAVTAGQYAWWSNFKLVAFCCGRGPLTHPMVDGPLTFMTILLLPFSPHRTMLPSTVGTRVSSSFSFGQSQLYSTDLASPNPSSRWPGRRRSLSPSRGSSRSSPQSSRLRPRCCPPSSSS